MTMPSLYYRCTIKVLFPFAGYLLDIPNHSLLRPL